MKVTIIFDSNTGNTKQIASCIQETCQEQNIELIESIDDADLIFLGTWIDKGNCSHKIQEILKAHGKEAIIGKGDSRIAFEGQILGCNISAALSTDVDQYIYIGSGNFHPISISIETGKDLIVLDPQMNEVRELNNLKDKILRQRHGAITRAQNAEHFLILASSKPGQIRMDKTVEVKKLLESKGKTADVIIMERFDPEYLLPFNADAYVSTACSRIAIDDYLRYDKPILTPIELEIVLCVRDWEDYHLDFFWKSGSVLTDRMCFFICRSVDVPDNLATDYSYNGSCNYICRIMHAYIQSWKSH